MTISEMVITAMVASPATIYIECDGKKYRDAVELANKHGNRLVQSAEILSDHGIRIILEPEADFDLKSLGLPDTIDCGTVESPGLPEELGPFGEGDLANAEEVLGADE